MAFHDHFPGNYMVLLYGLVYAVDNIRYIFPFLQDLVGSGGDWLVIFPFLQDLVGSGEDWLVQDSGGFSWLKDTFQYIFAFSFSSTGCRKLCWYHGFPWSLSWKLYGLVVWSCLCCRQYQVYFSISSEFGWLSEAVVSLGVVCWCKLQAISVLLLWCTFLLSLISVAL